MNQSLALALALLGAGVPLALEADVPAAPQWQEGCLVLDNRVLGASHPDRPLPLMKGDPQHGFLPACSVAWSALSPKNQAIAVVGCYRSGMLQLANDSACGAGTGRLWVNTSWVRTSAAQQQPRKQVAVCQQLETSALAASRDYSQGCEPRKPEAQARSPAQGAAPPAVPRDLAVPPAAAGAAPHP